MQKIKLP